VRKTILLALAGMAMLSVTALTPNQSKAVPFGSPEGMRGAAEEINPVAKAACWRYGWHGWGWYPCGYRVYGYGYRRWGYRRWGYRHYGWRGGGHWGGHGHWRRSDLQIKHDVVLLGRLDNGLNLYRFSYNGSNKAYVGVIAQEVQKVLPGAVARGSDGYLRVNYDRVGVRFQTWDEWTRSGGQVRQ